MWKMSACSLASVSTPRGLRSTIVRQNVRFDLLVALEDHRIDDRVLDHGDDQHAAALDDADVGEQAGGVERLDRSVDVGGAVGLAGLDGQVGLDGRSFDALVALDLDAGSNRGLGDSRADQRRRRRRTPAPPTPAPDPNASLRAKNINEFMWFECLARLPVQSASPSGQTRPVMTQQRQNCSLLDSPQGASPSAFPNLTPRCPAATHGSLISQGTQMNNIVPGCENH